MGVPRDHIDFVENYSLQRKSKNLKINFYAVRFMVKVVEECERFYKARTQKKPRSDCRAF